MLDARTHKEQKKQYTRKRVCCFFDLEIEEYVEIAQKIYIFGMLCAIVERILLRLLTGIRVENK